jgi:hypothetical protein
MIIGNKIDDSYIYAIFVKNADGLKVIGNMIGSTFIRGHAFAAGELYGVAPSSGIFVGMTKGAEIRNNTVAKGVVTRTPVIIDRTCLKNTIMVHDNTLT